MEIKNLATHIPQKLTVYEFLTELNFEQLEEMKKMIEEVKLLKGFFFEKAKKMVAKDIEKYKKSIIEIVKDNQKDYTKYSLTDLFKEMYHQSIFQQGYTEESENDFGYVLYMARVEEDREDELLEFAGKEFEKHLESV